MGDEGIAGVLSFIGVKVNTFQFKLYKCNMHDYFSCRVSSIPIYLTRLSIHTVYHGLEVNIEDGCV